jgi:hypothetical protein
MENLEYTIVYADVDEELEEELINFWATEDHVNVERVKSNFNKIVLVLINGDEVFQLNEPYVIDEYGVKRNLNGDKVYGKILGFSYVDRHYLEKNMLYYFYREFIPFPKFNTDYIREKLYEKTREYLKILEDIVEFSEESNNSIHRLDSGKYLGIALQKKDDLLTSKFGFEYYKFTTENFEFNYDNNSDKCGCWIDRF